MSDSDSNASSRATAPDPSETPAIPIAWQPLTFGGVAAFSTAKAGRLFLVQTVVALLVAGAASWFLSVHWFPAVRIAIRELPDAGAIRDGQLVSPRDSAAPLVETRYLCIAVDAMDTGVASSFADVRIEFHKTHWAACAFAGCVTRRYPAGEPIQFNRPEFEAWWGAWQPMLFGLIPVAIVAALFASWLVLATFGGLVAWLIAYFKDRQLSGIGAWKLAGAALLPGALLIAAGIVLYGLGIVNLLQLLCIWIAHVPVGWAYLAAAPFRLPRAIPKSRRDPFGTAPRPRRRNPCGGQ